MFQLVKEVKFDTPVQRYIVKIINDLGISNEAELKRHIYAYFDRTKEVPKDHYNDKSWRLIQMITGQIAIKAKVAQHIIQNIFGIEEIDNEIKQLIIISKGKDLRGQRFGKLVVKEVVETGDDKRLTWKCDCDCGREHVVFATSLMSGRTTSCGCYGKSVSANKFRIYNTTREREGIDFSDRTDVECESYVRQYILKILLEFGIKDTVNFRKIIYRYFDKRGDISKDQYVSRAGDYVKCVLGDKPIGPKMTRDIVEGMFDIIISDDEMEQYFLIGKGKDLRGQRFGKLVVKDCVGTSAKGNLLYKCDCDCGNESTVMGSRLIGGRTTSCGCYVREVASAFMVKMNTTHGMSESPEYTSWEAMIQRCCNQNNDNYDSYGGRGITICDEWRNSFKNFYEDMGDRPDDTSIDRIDNDGPYAPWNCRWATKEQQMNNRRITLKFDDDDDNETISDFAKRNNLSYNFVRTRYTCGDSKEEILERAKRQAEKSSH